MTPNCLWPFLISVSGISIHPRHADRRRILTRRLGLAAVHGRSASPHAHRVEHRNLDRHGRAGSRPATPSASRAAGRLPAEVRRATGDLSVAIPESYNHTGGNPTASIKPIPDASSCVSPHVRCQRGGGDRLYTPVLGASERLRRATPDGLIDRARGRVRRVRDHDRRARARHSDRSSTTLGARRLRSSSTCRTTTTSSDALSRRKRKPRGHSRSFYGD